VPVDAVHAPDPATRALHDRRFAAFRRLHRAIRGVV
jgi:hypothetical protein